jgi:hypothetical protein
MTRFACAFALTTAVAVSPAAQAQTLVLELFTSQSCSSCPPADALLTELARQPGVLALDMHVDYWNGIGWHDPYSFAALTERQSRYTALLHQDADYTPELVVGGRLGVVGSDRGSVGSAIAAVRAAVASAPAIGLRLRRSSDGIAVAVAAGAGPATVWLVGYDPQRITRVAGGENGGRTLIETNVVRSLMALGAWSGAALQLHAAIPAGLGAAVLLQAADGRVIAAATLDPG